MRVMCLGRTMILAWLLFGLAAAVMAQSLETDAEQVPREGPWALLFQVKGDFTLAPFRASKVSLQRDLASASAVRFGVGVYTTSSDVTSSSQTDKHEIDISLFADYLDYPVGREDVSLFVGAGPILGIASRSELGSSHTATDTSIVSYESRSEEDSWYLGLDVLLGAEWVLTPHIALNAEYASDVRYTRRAADRTTRRREEDGEWQTTYEDHPESGIWSFGDLQVKLGLAIYF